MRKSWKSSSKRFCPSRTVLFSRHLVGWRRCLFPGSQIEVIPLGDELPETIAMRSQSRWRHGRDTSIGPSSPQASGLTVAASHRSDLLAHGPIIVRCLPPRSLKPDEMAERNAPPRSRNGLPSPRWEYFTYLWCYIY